MSWGNADTLTCIKQKMIEGGVNIENLRNQLVARGLSAKQIEAELKKALEEEKVLRAQRASNRGTRGSAAAAVPAVSPRRSAPRRTKKSKSPSRSTRRSTSGSRSRSSSVHSAHSPTHSVSVHSPTHSVHSSPASPQAQKTTAAAQNIVQVANAVKSGSLGLLSGAQTLGSALMTGASWALQWGSKKLARALEADADALEAIRERNRNNKALGIYEGYRERDAIQQVKNIANDAIANAKFLASVPQQIVQGASQTLKDIEEMADEAGKNLRSVGLKTGKGLYNASAYTGKGLMSVAKYAINNWPKKESLKEKLRKQYSELNRDIQEAEWNGLMRSAHSRHTKRELENANFHLLQKMLQPKMPVLPNSPVSAKTPSPVRPKISPSRILQLEKELDSLNRQLALANDRLGLIGKVTAAQCLESSSSGKSPSCDNFIRSLTPEQFELFISQIRSEATKEILRLVRETGKDRGAIIEAKALFQNQILPSYRETNKYRSLKGLESLPMPSFYEYYMQLLRRPAIAPQRRQAAVAAEVPPRPKISLPSVGRLGNRAISLPGTQNYRVSSPKSIGRTITSLRIKVKTGRLTPQQALQEFRSLFNPGQHIDQEWIKLIEDPNLPQPNNDMFNHD